MFMPESRVPDIKNILDELAFVCYFADFLRSTCCHLGQISPFSNLLICRWTAHVLTSVYRLLLYLLYESAEPKLCNVIGVFSTISNSTRRLYINTSSVVEFQRWWFLKSKIFAQESTCSKEIWKNNFCRWITVHQKVAKLYFKCCFFRSKIVWNLKKKIILENQFRRPLFVKISFFSFNFWTTLFSKIRPNFWRTGASLILKIQWFPLSILIFGQKSCFLRPTIFRIPQPNWYYCIIQKIFL